MTKRVLITGIAGFMGSHLAEHILKNIGWDIVGIDKLTYASRGLDRLRDNKVLATHHDRVDIITADFSRPITIGVRREIGEIDYIFHLGAETHVDNSIKNPRSFVEANVMGTCEMLEFARTVEPELFVYFSTDEVFGPAPIGIEYHEWSRYDSRNPYAAAKAGGEELTLAYANTYNIPVLVTHCMNLFGERQSPEKFIPSTIKKVLHGQTVTIHANSECTQAGSRFYIHCRNVADALLFLTESTWTRHKINIVGEREVDNLEMAQFIADVVGKPLKYEMVDFHSSRPGHDLRYALDGTLLAKYGWKPPKTFEESLEKTIKWTLEHVEWLTI